MNCEHHKQKCISFNDLICTAYSPDGRTRPLADKLKQADKSKPFPHHASELFTDVSKLPAAAVNKFCG